MINSSNGSSSNADPPKVSIRKTIAQFLRKKAQIFAFVVLHFYAKKKHFAIICKLHFAKNFAIPLMRYSVLHNFAEQILNTRLNKGVNCIN